MLVNLKVVNEICKKMLSSKAQEPTIAIRGETVIHKTFYVSTRLIYVSNVLSSLVRCNFIKIFLCHCHHLVGMFLCYGAHMLKIQPDAG